MFHTLHLEAFTHFSAFFTKMLYFEAFGEMAQLRFSIQNSTQMTQLLFSISLQVNLILSNAHYYFFSNLTSCKLDSK